ncbi:hypothetical protein L484_015607 [Morus notabilis]|uniref:Uncharacterized protein n=1 Tax=Morus notabilis TaxID=981085 RepID=W9R8L6_9ROSA|nr:hypothetical protein L484_015607 [Morus notabilis]
MVKPLVTGWSAWSEGLVLAGHTVQDDGSLQRVFIIEGFVPCVVIILLERHVSGVVGLVAARGLRRRSGGFSAVMFLPS